MRFHYLLYSDAQKKLDSSGLLDKIEQVKNSEDRLPFIGHTTKIDVVEAIKEMREDGYFEALSKELRGPFMKRLNTAFQDEDSVWKIERGSRVITEPNESEDFYLMTGWLASSVLNKEELWDYKKHGFDNVSDFIGSMGVAIWTAMHGELRSGYEWISNDSKGRRFKNNITGDINLDLRIHQTDITPDKTIDPTGAQVSYRPELDEDRRNVIGYHSTEPQLLVGVLKWIKDANIPSEMLKDKGKPLLDYTKSLGHRIGAATECFGDSGGFMDSPKILLSDFDTPLAKINDSNSRSFDGIFTENQNYYMNLKIKLTPLLIRMLSSNQQKLMIF
jgi:hypothetical protein